MSKKKIQSSPRYSGPSAEEIFTPGNRISAHTAEERIFVLEQALKVTVDVVHPMLRGAKPANMLIAVDMFSDLKNENDHLKQEIKRLTNRLRQYVIF